MKYSKKYKKKATVLFFLIFISLLLASILILVIPIGLHTAKDKDVTISSPIPSNGSPHIDGYNSVSNVDNPSQADSATTDRHQDFSNIDLPPITNEKKEKDRPVEASNTPTLEISTRESCFIGISRLSKENSNW